MKAHITTSSRRRGYTVVEVMMALAVLGIGAAGVVAMQRTTLLGNVNGRNLATANAVAATWAERVRNDAALWQRTSTGANTINNTTWLKAAGTSFPTKDTDEGKWKIPTADATAKISPWADVRGEDTFNSAEAAFCTNLRMYQLLPNMIRVEIRVFWLRHRGGGLVSGAAGDLCGQSDAYPTDVVGESPERYHFVYLTTSVIRE